MKKITLFLSFSTFVIMYSCKEGGMSDKYGHSTDTVFTNGPNVMKETKNVSNKRLKDTAFGRPEPDTSFYYKDSKKKK